MQAAESDNSAAAWTFSQCLDYAYSNNISLQRLVLDNQSDDATLEQSKAQWQPTLGFSTTQGYVNYASPSETRQPMSIQAPTDSTPRGQCLTAISAAIR